MYCHPILRPFPTFGHVGAIACGAGFLAKHGVPTGVGTPLPPIISMQMETWGTLVVSIGRKAFRGCIGVPIASRIVNMLVVEIAGQGGGDSGCKDCDGGKCVFRSHTGDLKGGGGPFCQEARFKVAYSHSLGSRRRWNRKSVIRSIR